MYFRKIKMKDFDKLDQLFRRCLTDLITREQKDPNLIDDEVARLNHIVHESFLNKELHFFAAEIQNQIVGTIALTPPNPFITENVSTVRNAYEVGCVYILPSFQRNGVGKFMFQQIKKELSRLGKREFYLDAGFSSSQQYWEHVLGEPSFILEDYWGKGEHHLIWIRTLT